MGKHEEWRKVAKKARRKRIRKQLAILRDEELKKKLNSPNYQKWLKEQEELDLFAEEEEKKIQEERERKWIQDELLAQEQWKKHQKILAKETLKKKLHQQLIREEWEKEQKKIEEEQEKKRLEDKKRKESQELLLLKTDEYLKGERQNLPEELQVLNETQPGKPVCPFFSKTATCRYKNECSRNHVRPAVSNTLLFPGFYTHFSLDGVQHTEYDTDISLEYEHSETYNHFLEFYYDIKHELEKYGKLIQLKVCLNTSPHIRGNVYVSYESPREALYVYRVFNGRYYAGRPISIEFINIPSWKNALCGLQYSNKCPKGNSCNFLHVFKNPGREFQNVDNRLSERRREKSHNDWQWSESSTSDDDNDDDFDYRNRSRMKKSKERRKSRSKDRSHYRNKNTHWRWSESPPNDDDQRSRKQRRSNDSNKSRERSYSRSRTRRKRSLNSQHSDKKSDNKRQTSKK